MSSGKQLQEMDVASGIKQSKTAVNANAKPADSMPTMACLLYTSPSPRDNRVSRMPSSA